MTNGEIIRPNTFNLDDMQQSCVDVLSDAKDLLDELGVHLDRHRNGKQPEVGLAKRCRLQGQRIGAVVDADAGAALGVVQAAGDVGHGGAGQRLVRSSSGRSSNSSSQTSAVAALAWRRVAKHAEMQAKGRDEYYEDYTLFAGTPTRLHRFSRTAP